ncbi:MAG: ROK family protein [Actinomycetales bacterium]|nr:ROK family protein [Actinomycetales bacterium]
MKRFLGVDLGGTNIKYAVIEIDGTSIKEVVKDQISTEAKNGPDHVTDRIATLIKKIDGEMPIVGVAVAVPGIFNHDTGEILLFPNLPGAWENYPFTKKLREATRKSIALINDARAFCLAESTLGAGRGHRYVACIVMGTGVGGGLVIDGKVHEGATRGAGEIAHQVVAPDGPVCGCGTRGCVEALTSSAAISEMAGTNTPEEAYERAKAGDENAIAAFRSAGKWLGIALANVNAVFSPEIFIVGGGVAQAGDLVLDFIRAELHERNHLWPNSAFKVVPAQLSFFAGATGAALKAAAAAGTQLSFTSIT